MIFDTHAHYEDRKYNKDRDELMKQLRAAGKNCGCRRDRAGLLLGKSSGTA